jgi:hypothetical protein
MKIKLKRDWGEFVFDGYVTKEGVEFDIPLNLFVEDLHDLMKQGMNLNQAVDRCCKIITEESSQFAHEIPIGK